jgi:VanZ family protein
MLPLAHRRVWLALSVLLLAGVILGSLVPTGRVPHPGVSDKLVHAGAYFFLAIWFGGLTYRSAHGVVLLGLLALGAALEVLQGAMHLGRTADLMDLAANAAGIVAGLTVLRLSGTSWADRVEAWMKA